MHSHGHTDLGDHHRHADGHSHGAGQGHGASEENHAARRHPEPVVLDIGDDLGALIVHTDAAMHGVEVEISASGHDDERTHKDVLEREINGRPAYTAVFDKLSEGTYTLWVDDVARASDVVVTGAAVAELDWSVGLAHARRPALLDAFRGASSRARSPT
jgi:hypothetical protein